MTDNTRLAEIDARIDFLEAELRILRKERATIRFAIFERLPKKSRMRGGIAGGKSGRAANWCFDVISQSDRPVPIGDLFDGLLAAGLEVGGRDEKSNLAGYLSRDPRMKYVRPRGWVAVSNG